MKTKSILSILILTSLTIYLISCDNNMISNSDVSGNIYSSNYSPAANVKVSIGDAVTRTSSDGSFKINNVNYPYTVTVLDSHNRRVSVFKKLSTDKVYLKLHTSDAGPYQADISVQVPDSLTNSIKKGKLIFTDQININSYSDISDGPETYMRVYLNDNNPVTGKIILLTYNLNSSGKIISYENFGYLDNVAIGPGGSYNYSFDSASISLNPDETTVFGNVNLSHTGNELGSSFTLSFSNNDYLNGRVNNDFPGASGTIFNFLIPANLPLPFNTFMYKSYYFGGSGSRSFALYKVFPGGPNTINPKTAATLNSPEDNAKNITMTTPFSFYDETGSGVYEISINDRSRFANYTIVTTLNDFTLQDIDQSGLGSLVNHDFNWYVFKNGVYNSMNEYAQNIKNETNWFNTVSNSRNFSTEP